MTRNAALPTRAKPLLSDRRFNSSKNSLEHLTADPTQEDAKPGNSALLEKLGRIEEKLDALLSQAIPQDYYSVADVARLVDRAEFTVRQWCLQGRIKAEKRPCGRGLTREWMISRDELQRLRSEGLLPTDRQSLRRA